MNAPESLPDGGRAHAASPALADHAINFLSSPGHLRATAHLYGLSSVSLDEARVLVLGCRAGANVFPFAAAYPRARILGIDADDAQIEAARQNATALGLKNVEFGVAEYASVSPELGEFDYIVAHDVYSLLDRERATEILRICRLNLAFEGIAYVNYDTYPGARAAEAVRDAMILYGHGAETVEDGREAARAALTLFTNGIAPDNPMATALHQAAEQSRADLDAGLFGVTRQPYYFVEFAEQAAAYAMVCAGDAQPQIEMPDTYGTGVSLAHGLLGLGKPRALRQQNLDFSTGRQNRRSLLVHQERQEQLLSQVDSSRLMDLRWAGRFQRRSFGLRDAAKVHFETFPGHVFSTPDVVIQFIADALGAAWPESLPAARLVELVQDASIAPEGKTALEATQVALLYLFRQGLGRYALDAHVYDSVADNLIGVVPEVLTHFQAQDRGSSTPLFNLWHEAVILEDADQSLLNHLNQQSPLETFNIPPALDDRESTDDRGVDAPTSSRREQDSNGVALSAQLRRLKFQGALLLGPSRWRDYLYEALAAGKGEVHLWAPYVHALARCDLRKRPEPRQLYGVTPAQQQEATELRATAYGGKPNADLEARVRRLIKRAPRCDVAWDALGAILRDKGDLAGSLTALLEATRLDPRQAHRFVLMALTLMPADRLEDAEASCLRALALSPKYASAHNALGNAFHRTARFYESIFHYQRAIELDPTALDSVANYGVVLAEMGDFEGAERQYRKVVDHTPNDPQVWGSRFFALNYFPDRRPEQIFEVYREYDRIFGEPARKHWLSLNNDRNPNRKLRIGYVSPDFRHHPVTLFLEPLMAHHDKAAFEVYAYSYLEAEDEMTEAFKGYADHWVRTNGMSDDVLMRRIRADKIDILIDLAGHTGNNRLAVFNRKPAPVQVTWLGFGCTTGLSAIDYILSDDDMAPAGSDHLFAEQPWRLQGSNFAYRPKEGMGEVGPLPAIANGHVRLVTLSRAIRMNDHLLRVWAEILRRLPTAKLVVDSRSYYSAGLREDLVQRFALHGVDSKQLEVGFHSPPWDVLRNADITLDCFPHNSGTTLFESLYMGVPFVSLARGVGVGRIGASVLTGLGRPEWCASTEAEYVDKVVAMASDIPALARTREGLREELRASSLMDEPAFARKVEAAFREMFKQWCEKQA
ncbi:methyltransferase domain-containing protein [Achromobacter animicus]|uniref:O-linked N-acetylglucosamine transferase family protein n=1 Tax=Achromobacter animicus TaxID=1389935 RepID=UPI002448C548|nr:methyltransferase domain-containing protein [Achromobacter animicus]MDH0685277.1 methyltransferase domain-containing protein [Achromobacter animicus]